MPPQHKEEIDDAVLEEGCYYLADLGLTTESIAKHFELSVEEVERYKLSYARKLKSDRSTPDEFDRMFWDDVRKEAEGDVKITFLSEKGFHHGWKSDLERLDGPELMAIFEAGKDFLNVDPNRRFLDYAPPTGYDPLALEREVKKSLEIVSNILGEKWEKEKKNGDDERASKPKGAASKTSKRMARKGESPNRGDHPERK